jgi:hypothetical protein
MSCGTQRWQYWERLNDWIDKNIPDDIQESLEKAAREYIEDLLKAGGRVRGKRSPRSRYIENRYAHAKQEARQRTASWTRAERDELSTKTDKLLRGIRRMGIPEGLTPVHSQTGLPRISSQAGYAAVYDQLTGFGIRLDSPFDLVYQAIRQDEALSPEMRKSLNMQLERLERELQHAQLASLDIVLACLEAIRQLSVEIFTMAVDIMADPDSGLSDVALLGAEKIQMLMA